MIEFVYILIAALIIAYLVSGIRLFDQHTRGVVYTLGRQTRTTGPGVSIIFPGIEKLKHVSVKQKSIDLGELQLTLTNGQVQVKAAAFIKISDPKKSLDVQDLDTMIVQSGRSSIKTVLGEKTSDYIIKNGSKVLEEIKENLDEDSKSLGVSILSVKVYDFKVKKVQEKKQKKPKTQTKKQEIQKSKEPESDAELKKVDVDDDFLLD